MKKVFKWVVIVIAVIIAIFVIGGLMLPSTWKISENITVSAPEDRVFEQVANLH